METRHSKRALALVAALALTVAGCGTLGGAEPEQLAGATCLVAERATYGAVEYLRTAESREGRASDRQAIREAMGDAYLACQIADGLIPAEGAEPGAARARLVRALARLASEVPALREDEALMRQIVLLAETLPEARDAFLPADPPAAEEDDR